MWSWFTSLCRSSSTKGPQRLGQSITMAVFFYLVGIVIMYYITNGRLIPDMVILLLLSSFPKNNNIEQIQTWLFHEWGPQERKQYILSSWIDLFLIMPSYTYAMGTLLYWSATSTGVAVTTTTTTTTTTDASPKPSSVRTKQTNDNNQMETIIQPLLWFGFLLSPDMICLAALFTWLFDLVETIMLQQACQRGWAFTWQIQLASWANCCKFVSFLVLLIVIVVLRLGVGQQRRQGGGRGGNNTQTPTATITVVGGGRDGDDIKIE